MGYLESIKSPKGQIRDFNPNYLISLIGRTLNGSIELRKKAYEYKAQADALYKKVKEYKALADKYSRYANDFKRIADRLSAYANRYKTYAISCENRSKYYKQASDRYLRYANYYKSSWLGPYFTKISDMYENYSKSLAYQAKHYLGKSYTYSYSAYKNKKLAQDYKKKEEYYRDLYYDTLRELEAAQETAKNLMVQSQNYHADGEIVENYVDMFIDRGYNYFYKVLRQDAFGRVTKYISGNGLITENNYDSSGVMESSTTGYEFDDKLRRLTFEYDKLNNVVTRKDEKLHVEQNYIYDDLNRLTRAYTDTLTNSSSITYEYDTIGNITYKSDIGKYNYGSTPHQVRSIANRYFSYDKNGI